MSSDRWKRFTEHYWSSDDGSLALDFSEVTAITEWTKDAESLFQKGLTELQQIESGERVNTDEDRMVGHYWLRDAGAAPTDELRVAITDQLAAIKSFASEIKKRKFTHLLQIGIGGSALGPQLFADCFGSADAPMQFWSLDNTDPDGISRVLTQIPNLEETIVLVVSKSGGTKETRNSLVLTEKAFAAKGISFANNAVAVTGEGSLLHQRATQEKWQAIFPMWDWVGGRTSVWSSVGLLPAALLGIDIDGLLAGAKSADVFGRATELENNPAALLALCWYHFADNGKDMVVLPYKDRLLLLSRYLQQLVMESLGKAKDRSGQTVEQGLSVYGNKGSTDQHAYVQQLRDGRNNFFALFVEVLKDFSTAASGSSVDLFGEEVEEGATAGDYLHGFYLGTRKALADNDRQSITVTVPELSAQSLGLLIALFERAVSFYAAYADINAYHQPGVEAGKKAAGEALVLQQKVVALVSESDSGMTVEEIAEALATDQCVHIFKIVERLVALGSVQKEGEKIRESRYS